jgi:hypothetical protein
MSEGAELRERIAAGLERAAAVYDIPEVWPEESLNPNAIAAHAMRHAYREAAKMVRGGTLPRPDERRPADARPAERIVQPDVDWPSAWTELTGYVQQAREDGEQIDPADLLAYMAELRRSTLAPVRAWMAAVAHGRPGR